jgi:hypothetical protein
MIRYGTDFQAWGILFMYLPAFTQILEALAEEWRDDPDDAATRLNADPQPC